MDITSGSAGENLRICFGCMRPLSGDERICPVCGYDMEATQPAMFLKPGTYLARRYLVGKALSYDKYFITYLALDMVSNQRVEVKEYFPSEFVARLSEGRVNVYAGAAGEAFLAGLRKFWEEESSPQRSNLDGVVKVLDLFQANQTAYAVLERIEGKTLHEHLETNRMLPVSEATNILKQVLASLGFIHKAGLTYREFLPENILISEGGEVKLRDFGTVPMQFWVSPTEDPLWNAGCAPPEFMRADFKWNVQSDIYVLGTLFYEMITGHPPLDGQTRQRGGVLQLPSNLGIEIEPYVEDILQKSLSISPDERYKGAEEFLAALEKQGKKPGMIPFQPDKHSLEIKDKNPRSKWLVLGLGGAVVLGLFLFFGMNSGNKEEQQLELGRKYLASGEYKAAQSAYAKALSLNPDSEEAMLGLSRSYIESGDVEAAEEWYEKFNDVIEDADLSALTDSLRSEYDSLVSEFEEQNLMDGDLADSEGKQSTVENLEESSDLPASKEEDDTEDSLEEDLDFVTGEEIKEDTGENIETEETIEETTEKQKTATKKSKKKKNTEKQSKNAEKSTVKIEDERIEKVKDSYLLADSDVSSYSTEKLSSLSSEVLVFSLCEIYARRGLKFESATVSAWFESFRWYHGRTNTEEDASKYFTDVEKENLNVIKALLVKQGYDFGGDIENASVDKIITVVLPESEKDGGSDTGSSVYTALLDYMDNSDSQNGSTFSSSDTSSRVELGEISNTNTSTQSSATTYSDTSTYSDTYQTSDYYPSYSQDSSYSYDDSTYQQSYQQDTYTPGYGNSNDDYDSGIGFGYSDYGDDHGGSDDYEYSISDDIAFGDGGYNVTVE